MCLIDAISSISVLKMVFGPVENGEDVRWCVWTEKRKVPLLSTLCYGNESTA